MCCIFRRTEYYESKYKDLQYADSAESTSYYHEVTCKAEVPHFTQLGNKETLRREEAMVEVNLNK
jgi:hypothetical protein